MIDSDMMVRSKCDIISEYEPAHEIMVLII